MERRTLLSILLYAALNVMSNSAQNKPADLSEHCFEISNDRKIAIEQVTTTPETFLRLHPNVDAAINGPYIGGKDQKNYRTQGIAYIAEGHQLADGDLRYIRGYFTVSKSGRQIQVSETLDGTGTLDQKLRNYWVVIGTHPLLVVDGKIHNQATEDRYEKNSIEPFVHRSAIGIREGKACFVVSEDKLTMKKWAERLQNKGYKGALNLNGDTYSQMAERNDGKVKVMGKGKANTRLIIYDIVQ